MPPSDPAPEDDPEDELPDDDPEDEPEEPPDDDVEPEPDDPDEEPEFDPEDELPDDVPEDEPDDELLPDPPEPPPPPSASFPRLPALLEHAPNAKAVASTGTPSNHRATMQASVGGRSPVHKPCPHVAWSKSTRSVLPAAKFRASRYRSGTVRASHRNTYT